MSDNSPAKLIVMIAAVALGLIIGFLKSSPAPPDDPWFQARVVESPNPVIVKFGAEWCPPCRMIDNELQNIRSRYSGRLDVVVIDIEEKPELVHHYNVGSIPRVFLMENGKVKRSRVGYASQQQLVDWATPYMN